ncbi:unnamed protein product, partial [Anisakis simplex]|uniref:Cyanocobalamin reductase (cyanide-eliminating) n=1 Tax=Anisakis simplex TaxID=6269 RepID=A0A0M3JNK7_ANISI
MYRNFCALAGGRDEADKVYQILNRELNEEDGFEWHRFRVGPYNAVVQEGVRLNYPDNTLAVLVL